MAELASWPVATWFTGGTTPAQTRSAVATLAAKATLRRQVPVVTAYNVPGRSQYSAGGAATTAEYEAWVDGLAAGLGRSRAVVILEPDGLALSPDQCGGTPEEQAARVTEINYAVDRLERQPGASVYVDAGHSAWHAVGDMAERLRDGGVARAQGFFLNVSNYRTDAELTRYGTMVAGCLWYLANVAGGVGTDCANQFWPAADADAWYAAHVPAGAPLTHFVLDTSRNGQGPWTPPAGVYSDPQDWGNPPGRGVGRPPTADTGTPLVDAYLWVKVPGESDGSCTRGTAGPVDPEWGVVDPAAGVWWPDQVHQLAALASPRLRFNPHALLGTR
jgi:endoglucanase